MSPIGLQCAYFGSAVVWLLITFPAYWAFQWAVERTPFAVWRLKVKRNMRMPPNGSTTNCALPSGSCGRCGTAVVCRVLGN
jgi:hypothetical protein